MFDSGISGMHRPLVICRKGDNTLVKVSDARTGKPALKKCDEIVTGCYNCANDGKSCLECHYEWYRKTDASCGSCGDKRIFGNCKDCNIPSGCIECEKGNFKFGYKCYTRFW